MLTATPRCGIRVAAATAQVIETCQRRDQFVRGPQIAVFERAFAARVGEGFAISTSCVGRATGGGHLEVASMTAGSQVAWQMLLELTGPFPYFAIFAAAVGEGEVVFLAASALAGRCHYWNDGALVPDIALRAGLLRTSLDVPETDRWADGRSY